MAEAAKRLVRKAISPVGRLIPAHYLFEVNKMRTVPRVNEKTKTLYLKEGTFRFYFQQSGLIDFIVVYADGSEDLVPGHGWLRAALAEVITPQQLFFISGLVSQQEKGANSES
jgi:hypothetical protein